ncbi:MAG: hypothetical protein H6867_09325 [Rhodospirillales bacterium]|nr:hypothetical protein [Rhodospirillales bacterium]
MMSTNKPRKIKASYELQNKVGMGPIDEKKVVAAQAMMDTSTVDFIVIARPELDQLHTVITAAKAGKDYSAETMTAIKTPIMNLKANAGTFKYSFISDLTGSVLMLFEGLDKADKRFCRWPMSCTRPFYCRLRTSFRAMAGNRGRRYWRLSRNCV